MARNLKIFVTTLLVAIVLTAGFRYGDASLSFVAQSNQVFQSIALGLAGSSTGSMTISGATSGVITIQPQAAAGTYNFNLPITAGTSGQPLLSGGGSGTAQTYGTLSVGGGGTGATTFTANALLKGNTTSALTATNLSDSGTALTSTDATFNFTAGASETIGTTDAQSLILKTNGTTALTITSGQAASFAGTLAATTGTLSSVADKALLVSNGGHISSLIGTGAAPTAGSGTVVTGSTDTAGEVTGATSGVTVTFGTGFAVKPVCLCNDETSATQTCKAVVNANGLSFTATTTGTDSFAYICIGK